MDNPYHGIDREDLEAYRRGEQPPKRKEIMLGPKAMLTPEQMIEKAMALFKKEAK